MNKTQILNEDSRSQLIQKSKKADNYAADNQDKGKNRYQRRLHSRISGSVSTYNNMDMNKLFKDNILDVNIIVHGETNDYLVRMSFSGFLDYLHNQLNQNNKQFDTRTISRALITAFNSDQVYIHCSCLYPDTKIKLLDGTCPTVEELKERFDSGEKLFAYSVDKNGDFKPGEIEKVWVTGNSSNFIKVTLDNGEYVITTPEHLYMLRDGSYLPASELKLGQSLMPLYFNTWQNGYDGVKLNSTGKYHSVYKLVADYYKSTEIQEALNRVNPDDNMKYDVAIHHIDFNKHNNVPDNLQIMTAREHWDYHNKLSFINRSEEFKLNSRKAASENAKKRNANPTPAMLEARRKFIAAGAARNYDEDRRQQQSELMRKTMQDFYANISDEVLQSIKDKIYTEKWRINISEGNKKVWSNYSDEAYKNRCEINHQTVIKNAEKIGKKVHEYWEQLSDLEKEKRRKINSLAIKNSWANHPEKYMTAKRKASDKLKGQYKRTEETIFKCNLSKISNIINKILDAGEIPSEETYNKYRTNGYPKYTVCFSSWQELSQYFNLNHSIVDIQYFSLDDSLPVYDIKVKDYENFLVDAGVILHNCPDWKYTMAFWATKNDIDSVKGEQPSNGKWIRNPADTKGAGCKHSLLVLSNNTWLMKVASVIRNYVNYMEKHNAKLYADIIYPAIYQEPYPDDVQLDMFSDDQLASDEETIDVANAEARTKGQFKKGNQSGVQFTSPDKQISLDDIEIEDEEN